MAEKPIPSIFQISDNYFIDLDKIVHIDETYIHTLTGIRLNFTVENRRRVLEAWIAYKGKFDPAKHR